MWVFNLWTKVKIYFFIAIGFLLWIIQIKWDARKRAREEMANEINKETQRKKDEWSKIDNSNISIDDALDGLRKHSRKDRNS